MMSEEYYKIELIIESYHKQIITTKVIQNIKTFSGVIVFSFQ